MNELSIKEKAQRYDEAIEVINKCETDKYGCIIGVKPTDIFPELKGSEDEKIRKEVISFVEQAIDAGYGIISKERKEEWIAWLEKKGEQKQYDKVEPKFHEGEWVVFNNRHQSIYQVEKIEDGYYILRHTHGGTFRVCVLHDESLRLWTIQEVKDGDVLSFNDGHGNDCIELIKSITDKKIEFWFCLTNSNRYEVFDGNLPYTNLASRKDATPATKEQRDLLFAKMKEAGYEWDAEKKELKKIEQKVAWSEENKRKINRIYSIIGQAAETHAYSTTCRLIGDKECIELQDFIKSLKDGIQPQSQWKPSDEQIMALRWVLNNVPYNKYKEEISGLLDQIKDL